MGERKNIYFVNKHSYIIRKNSSLMETKGAGCGGNTPVIDSLVGN